MFPEDVGVKQAQLEKLKIETTSLKRKAKISELVQKEIEEGRGDDLFGRKPREKRDVPGEGRELLRRKEEQEPEPEPLLPEPVKDEVKVADITWQAKTLLEDNNIPVSDVPYEGAKILVSDVRNYLSSISDVHAS